MAIRQKDKAPGQYFKGDYRERYVKVKPITTGLRGERNAEKSIREDPSGSIAAWVWNFDSLYTQRIQSLVNRGKYTEATDLYEEAMSTINENESSLFALTDLAGAGETSDELASRASRLLNNPFTATTAKFNGADVALDAILRDGGSLAAEAARDEFMALGLSSDVADAFFGDDDVKRATVRNLIQPLVSGQKEDYGQRIELAEDVVSNWDELHELFGDGISHFIARHQASHTGAGGASDSLRSLVSIARNLYTTTGVSGKDLAREVLGAYDGLVTKVFAQDTSTIDAQGRPRDTPISASKRMSFDAALASSVKELENRGLSADLRSASFVKALTDVMDAQAYASDCGVDLIGVGHDTGNPMAPAFGQYVADMVSGVTPTGANPVNALRAYRHFLDNQITGGVDFAEQVYRATGDTQSYLASLNKANGGYSSSPGADVIARGIKAYITQNITPGMVAGLSPDEALRSARSGSLHSGVDFLVGLSANIEQHLYGPDRERTANLIAASVIDQLDRGQKVSIEETVRDLAFGEEAEAAGSSDVAALRDWYWGNVTQAQEYAQKVTQLRAHLTHDEGLPDYVAASEVSKAGQEAGRMRRLGRDGNEVYDARLRAGTVFWHKTDPATGQPVYDDAGNLVVTRSVVPDRTVYGYDPNGDNTEYNARQQNYRELEARKATFDTAYARKKATMAADPDA